MNEKWFALSVKEIEAKLKTNAATGLSRKAARSRCLTDSGKLFYTKTKKPYKMLSDVLADFALIILLITIAVSVIFAEGEYPIVVLALALISILISFLYYYRSQRTMEAMNALFRPTHKVIRGGKLYRVDIDSVAIGDVVLLNRGDVLGCDARIVTSDSLSVLMRVDKSNYVKLDKNAECAISENENDPKNMKNIIHAGSVVESGSARAIAVATGKYTYLGARTGGIVEPYSDNVPAELKKLRSYCSKISLFSMICVLPFCIISLLFGHLVEGEITLSAAFLTALAITVSTMSQLVCTHFKVFFVSKIKKLVHEDAPVAIRTTNAFDKLADMKYLFMLDGSALTDGVLHFDRAYTAEGEVKGYDTITSATKELFEYATMYRNSDASMITVGTREPNKFTGGLDEFLRLYKLDTEALKIRRPVRSYTVGNSHNEADRVFYSQDGKGMIISVSHSSAILSECTYAYVSGQMKRLNATGIDRFKHAWNRYTSQGKKVLIFTTSTTDSGDSSAFRCFVGMIVLREGVDKSAVKGISALERKGVKVISFVGDNCGAPAVPVEAQVGNVAHKYEFEKEKLDITYMFGEISTYYGLDEKDIERLIDYAHSQNAGVGVIGFSDYAPRVIEKSDVFISCADININKKKRFHEELKALEIEGTQASTSCVQTVKAEADVIVQRPSESGGGLVSLASAVTQIGVACRNLYVFFKYLLGSWLARICIAAIPMMLGYQTLDARHLLFFGFVLDTFALHMFATDTSNIPDRFKIDKFRFNGIKSFIKENYGFLISVILSSASVAVIPQLVGLIEPFGEFDFVVEYAFISAVWIQISMLYCVRYGSVSKLTKIFNNKYFIGIVVGMLFFVSLTLWNNPIGILFGFKKNPILYFGLSFIHPLLFALVYAIFRVSSKKR